MRIFLTGATGFIGSHVLKEALLQGHIVHALRRPAKSPRIPIAISPHWYEGALNDNWKEPLSQTDVLIHLAAYGVTDGFDDWGSCFRVNVIESLELWRQATEAGISRFIVCGSCFEYGRSGTRYDKIPADAPLWPTTAYAASKASATMAAIALAETHSLSLVVTRPFHIYGPGENNMRFWPSLVNAAKRDLDYPATSGEQIRDFTHVSFAAKKILELAIKTDPCEGSISKPTITNLGCGHPMTLREFADAEWIRLGGKGRICYGSLPYRANEVMRYVPDLSDVYDSDGSSHCAHNQSFVHSLTG